MASMAMGVTAAEVATPAERHSYNMRPCMVARKSMRMCCLFFCYATPTTVFRATIAQHCIQHHGLPVDRISGPPSLQKPTRRIQHRRVRIVVQEVSRCGRTSTDRRAPVSCSHSRAHASLARAALGTGRARQDKPAPAAVQASPWPCGIPRRARTNRVVKRQRATSLLLRGRLINYVFISVCLSVIMYSSPHPHKRDPRCSPALSLLLEQGPLRSTPTS